MEYKSILYIDDDTDDHEIFESALSIACNTTLLHSITSAKEALKLLEAKSLEPDIIFLDLNMPVMNGQQFLEEVKKKEGTKEIPVVIFSTTSNYETISVTKQLGALDFLTKPVKFNDLVEMLKTFVCKKEDTISPVG